MKGSSKGKYRKVGDGDILMPASKRRHGKYKPNPGNSKAYYGKNYYRYGYSYSYHLVDDM